MKDFLLQAAATFACMFTLDVVWVYYTKAVVAKAPWRAALWCSGITSMNALSAVLYVTDPRLIPAAILGAAVGTWVAMRWADA